VVDICALLQQVFSDLGVPILTGAVKSGETFAGSPVDRHILLKQQFYDLDTPIKCRGLERRKLGFV
jgi:hypothetical protein